MKKTNSKPRLSGGVQKNPEVRVKIKSEVIDVSSRAKDVKALLPKKLSKLKVEAMDSILGNSSEKILQLLESNENDSAVTLINKKLIQSLVDLIPLAEQNVRNSEGKQGVYQINSLISSLRELLTDMQSSQDRGMLGKALVEQVIRPVFLDIGMKIVEEYSMIAADAKESMDAKDYDAFRTYLKESRSRLAAIINAKYGDASQQAEAFLSR